VITEPSFLEAERISGTGRFTANAVISIEHNLPSNLSKN
jgi:hypothetical protein